MQSKSKAVIISDIHFTPNTLELATKAFKMALAKAEDLCVPLIVAGDTLDTKDIMRGSCVNRLIELVTPQNRTVEILFLIGNHDLLNEKSKEHSLNFLNEIEDCCVIKSTVKTHGYTFIPYQNSIQDFYNILEESTYSIICHQGLIGANMGHYVQDKSAISPERLEGRRIISGHYHKRQDIALKHGMWSYVGNPYSLSFGEALDPPKGFQILFEDGSVEFVPTNLRKHVILDITLDQTVDTQGITKEDLIWVKLHGPYLDLEAVSKKQLGEVLFNHSNFKLDKIPTDSKKLVKKTKSDKNLLNDLIDNTDESKANKKALKDLAKELLSED